MKLHLFGLGFHASVSWRGHVEIEPDDTRDDFGIGIEAGDSLLLLAGVANAREILS